MHQKAILMQKHVKVKYNWIYIHLSTVSTLNVVRRCFPVSPLTFYTWIIPLYIGTIPLYTWPNPLNTRTFSLYTIPLSRRSLDYVEVSQEAVSNSKCQPAQYTAFPPRITQPSRFSPTDKATTNYQKHLRRIDDHHIYKIKRSIIILKSLNLEDRTCYIGEENYKIRLISVRNWTKENVEKNINWNNKSLRNKESYTLTIYDRLNK